MCSSDLRIFAQHLAPGDRLPLRTAIEREFNAAPNTVQRAMARLAREGFITARGKRGTFVAPRPPHLHRIGLVWSSDPTPKGGRVQDRFSPFLYQESLKLSKGAAFDLVHYMGVDGHTDREGARRLLHDVQSQVLAGLVFDAPTALYRSPFYEILDTPHLPCVLLNHDFNHRRAIHVAMSPLEVIDRALDHLQAQGGRRVALLTAGTSAEWSEHFTRGVAARGLETRPFWIQGVPPGAAPCARNSMHLLMRATDAPDSLVITDDSLVEHATAGLADGGAGGLTVGSTGTIGGNGTISGNVILNGGTVAPGASAGTLTLGALAVNGSATYQWEIGPGTAYDSVTITNAGDSLTFDSSLKTLQLVDLGGSAWTNDTFVLFRYSSTLNDNAAFIANATNWTFSFVGSRWTNANARVFVDTTNNYIELTGVGLIPEPSTIFLLGSGFATLYWAWRRRRGSRGGTCE